MKQKRTGWFLLLASLLAFSAIAQTKHALIFAAGKYKAWPEISSLNDVPYIRSALETQGFDPQHITVVTNEGMTMNGIRQAFKNLIAQAGAGDVVVIHFSSHGEQVADDNQDETDGLDEAIVSWDAPFPVNRDHFEKDQALYFRDDEFGRFMAQLRAKLGANGDLLVILDACHSASATRGEHKTRGGQLPLVPNGFKPPSGNTSLQPEVFMDPGANTGPLSSYIIISGAQAAEQNSEMTDSAGVSMGSLTYALSQALRELKPGTTYRALFADILSAMNQVVPEQHPVLEGNGIDRELFGGRFVEQHPFAGITNMNGKEYTLDQGRMSGIETGAGVSLYPKGTTDPDLASPLAKGTVKSAGPYQSVVTWDKDPGLMTTADGWVFVTRPVYKIPPVILSITPKGNGKNFSAAESAQISRELKGLALVRTTGTPELRLVKGETEDSLLITANGYLFDTLHASEEGKLTEILKRYSQYKFLQQLSLTDPQCPLQVSLVPVVDGVAADMAKYMRNGLPEFRPGDKFVIRARNTGNIPLYLNVLDLQPDGKINPIFPNTEIRPKIEKNELRIEPGVDFTFKDFPVTIGPPFGLETFKIFVSPTEIDMESIARNAGTSTRNGMSTLETLVNGSFGIATRGDAPAGKPVGSAFNILFRIVNR